MSKRVIINADDFGITKGVNRSISELAQAGALTSTAVMTNMPYYEEITALTDLIGAGIHLTLTVGKPVSDPDSVPTLVDREGNFFSLPELLDRVKSGLVSKSEAASELEAQTERLIKIGVQPDHLNSHESFLKYPFFVEIAKQLGKAYNIPTVRIFSQRKFDFTRLLHPRKILITLYLAYQKASYKKAGFMVADRQDSLLKFDQDYQWSYDKFNSIIAGLPDGVLEIVVHPGYCDDETLPLGAYIHEREVEHEVLSKLAGKLRDIPGVSLIRFSDIAE